MSDPAHAGARRDRDDPASSSTLLVGGVGAVIVFIICVLLQALYVTTLERERQEKIYGQQPESLRRARVEQSEKLGEYRWVDRQQGIVAIPIERAMQKVVEEYERSGSAVPRR